MTESCRICGNDAGNRSFDVREMMLGTRDTFEYVECSRCGCLQIASMPHDLGRYYPEDYYSLQGSGALERWLKARWMAASLGRGGRTGPDGGDGPDGPDGGDGREDRHRRGGQGGLVGRVLARWLGPHPLAGWQRRAGFTSDSAILDVGCGDGRLLRTMRQVGFTDLTGTDPYLGREHRAPGLRLLSRPIQELDGPFDFIMMHHSLEHMEEPDVALEAAARLLRPGGSVLVRTPVAGSFAWRTYGPNWVQIDAPRHLHVFTEAGIERLAEQAGLELARTVYESSAFQFWGSELYARDIPYSPKPSYRNRPSRSLISRKQMKRYREQARELNATGDGDSAAFYLRRSLS